MTVDWLQRQPFWCYFYPQRDCPGWHAGQPCDPNCQRIGDKVPAQ